MVKLLLKKQLSEIFRSYFYDAKKNKPRSKASTVSLIVLYSWIIWAVAGVLYAAVMGIVRIISRSRG